jgi:Uma2 family endonuclease
MPTLVSTDAQHEYELLTAEEFLDWLEPGKHADLIDGEIFMHSPVNFKHARLLNFLDEALRRYIRGSQVGGELHREVVAVKLSSRNVFEPDLSWFSADQVKLLAETHAPFAPLWVCEALSPRTADRDVGPKFAAYEEHGVNEYWILDPHTLRHRFYARDGEVLVEFGEQGDWIESKTIPGFKVRRDWLHPDTHPNVDDILGELIS